MQHSLFLLLLLQYTLGTSIRSNIENDNNRWRQDTTAQPTMTSLYQTDVNQTVSSANPTHGGRFAKRAHITNVSLFHKSLVSDDEHKTQWKEGTFRRQEKKPSGSEKSSLNHSAENDQQWTDASKQQRRHPDDETHETRRLQNATHQRDFPRSPLNGPSALRRHRTRRFAKVPLDIPRVLIISDQLTETTGKFSYYQQRKASVNLEKPSSKAIKDRNKTISEPEKQLNMSEPIWCINGTCQRENDEGNESITELRTLLVPTVGWYSDNSTKVHHIKENMSAYRTFHGLNVTTEDIIRTELGILWETHLYVIIVMFTLISLVCVFCTVRLTVCWTECPNRCYLLAAAVLTFTVSTLRIVYLLHDPYNVNNSYSLAEALLLHNIVYPLLTSVFAILFMSAVSVTRTRVFPLSLQRPRILTVVTTVHFSVWLTHDILVATCISEYMTALPALTLLHAPSILWPLLLSASYLYAFRDLHKVAIRKQGELILSAFTKLHIDGAALPRKLPHPALTLAVKVLMVTALFLAIQGALISFGWFVLGPDLGLKVGPHHQWLPIRFLPVWFGYQLLCRLIEVAIGSSVAYMCANPFRHDKLVQGSPKSLLTTLQDHGLCCGCACSCARRRSCSLPEEFFPSLATNGVIAKTDFTFEKWEWPTTSSRNKHQAPGDDIPAHLKPLLHNTNSENTCTGCSQAALGSEHGECDDLILPVPFQNEIRCGHSNEMSRPCSRLAFHRPAKSTSLGGYTRGKCTRLSDYVGCFQSPSKLWTPAIQHQKNHWKDNVAPVTSEKPVVTISSSVSLDNALGFRKSAIRTLQEDIHHHPSPFKVCFRGHHDYDQPADEEDEEEAIPFHQPLKNEDDRMLNVSDKKLSQSNSSIRGTPSHYFRSMKVRTMQMLSKATQVNIPTPRHQFCLHHHHHHHHYHKSLEEANNSSDPSVTKFPSWFCLKKPSPLHSVKAGLTPARTGAPPTVPKRKSSLGQVQACASGFGFSSFGFFPNRSRGTTPSHVRHDCQHFCFSPRKCVSISDVPKIAPSGGNSGLISADSTCSSESAANSFDVQMFDYLMSSKSKQYTHKAEIVCDKNHDEEEDYEISAEMLESSSPEGSCTTLSITYNSTSVAIDEQQRDKEHRSKVDNFYRCSDGKLSSARQELPHQRLFTEQETSSRWDQHRPVTNPVPIPSSDLFYNQYSRDLCLQLSHDSYPPVVNKQPQQDITPDSAIYLDMNLPTPSSSSGYEGGRHQNDQDTLAGSSSFTSENHLKSLTSKDYNPTENDDFDQNSYFLPKSHYSVNPRSRLQRSPAYRQHQRYASEKSTVLRSHSMSDLRTMEKHMNFRRLSPIRTTTCTPFKKGMENIEAHERLIPPFLRRSSSQTLLGIVDRKACCQSFQSPRNFPIFHQIDESALLNSDSQSFGHLWKTASDDHLHWVGGLPFYKPNADMRSGDFGYIGYQGSDAQSHHLCFHSEDPNNEMYYPEKKWSRKESHSPDDINRDSLYESEISTSSMIESDVAMATDIEEESEEHNYEHQKTQLAHKQFDKIEKQMLTFCSEVVPNELYKSKHKV